MSASTAKDPDALPQLVGDFQPVDIWQAHINRLFYGLLGTRVREFYQTFAAADFRLGFALAEDYWRIGVNVPRGQKHRMKNKPLHL
jgi:hypothetical protein